MRFFSELVQNEMNKITILCYSRQFWFNGKIYNLAKVHDLDWNKRSLAYIGKVNGQQNHALTLNETSTKLQ